MDYEYDTDEPYEGRILWGRIGVYGVAFLLVFLLGNCMGGRGTVPQSDVVRLNEQVAELASENTVLQRQVDDLSAAGGPAQPGPQPGESPDPGEGEGEPGTDDAADGDAAGDGDTTADAAGMRTYTVVSGDNLYGIALKMYGDGSKYRLIAEENGLDSSNRLTVGMELRIPPES